MIAAALSKIEQELNRIASEPDEDLADLDALRFALRLEARKIAAQREMIEAGLGE
jgi:hypothetical protein